MMKIITILSALEHFDETVVKKLFIVKIMMKMKQHVEPVENHGNMTKIIVVKIE